jgi:TonB-linked SusC/RagA family outer membrane protein
MKKNLLSLLLLSLLTLSSVFAQSRKITGTVTGADDGLPLPGVSVKVQGSTIGTQTNQQGVYTLTVPQTAKSLMFTFIGFTDQSIVLNGQSTFNVKLAISSKSLTEVVVVGYGTTTQQAFTGSAKAVSGEVLEAKRVDNVSQALAGEVAGVRVINTSGQPGTVATLRVRGFGSVNGNRDPLYVVDGVPFTGSINSINIADVESTTVLKDAVATAIYGSKGSAGVVLITTKNGKGSKPYVDADFTYGTNANIIPRYSVIKSPEQYAGLSWEALYNKAFATTPTGQVPDTYATAQANANIFSASGLPVAYNIWNSTGANLIDPTTRTVRDGITRKYDPENWRDYAFQHSLHTEANIRLGGASDKSTYYMSFGYLKDVGYSIGSDYRRLTGRVNLTNQVKPWLNASMNLNYAYSNQNVNGQSNDSGSIFWFADNIPSIYGLFLRDANGNIVPDSKFGGNQFDYGATAGGRKFGSLTNSIADATYNTNRNDRNELNGNIGLTAKIIDGLTFENTFGVQYFNIANINRLNKFYGSAASQNGAIYLDRQDVISYDILDLLRYKKKIGNNNFEVLGAHEAQKYTYGDLSASRYNLVQNGDESLDNGVVSNTSYSYTQGYTIDSFLGQINYDYKEKYYLSGSLRTDGSSRFVNNKWGTFGSIGAGWLISSEDFMQNQKLFSSLKLKASFGVIGDQSGVSLTNDYNVSTITNVNGQPGLSTPTIGNPDLTWETSQMSEIGVEFSLGKYLTGSVDYYLKNTTNLIFNRLVGTSNGFASIKVNDGKLQNKGLEFDLTAHILKNKDYHLDFGINGEVLSNNLSTMPFDPSTGQPQVLSVSGVYAYSAGHSIYDFYTKQYAGVNPANGNSTWNTYWVDLDGNGTPKTGTIEAGTGEYIGSLAAFEAYKAAHPGVAGINGAIQQTTTEKYTDASLQYTGQSAIPAVRGAFNLSGGYKGFDLSVQVLYSLGGYAIDSEYQTLMNDAVVGNNNWSTDITKAWKKAGDITDVPRLSSAQNVSVNSTSTRFITKADYLAINNVRLGYSFSKDLIKHVGMSNFKLWISADNLYLASKRNGFNPAGSEDGASNIYNYSPLTTFSAGINAKF